MKSKIKKVIPVKLLDYYSRVKYSKKNSKFKNKSVEEIFTLIYNTKYWNNIESISGPGSSIKQTEKIIQGINNFLKDFNIKSVIDIPCGDFNWMQYTNLSQISYIGADIVEDLINKNNSKYKTDHVNFIKLDLINDNIPKSDVIINRDCLVHFSYKDIYKSLTNIKNSNCKFFITTTFTKLTLNYDIVTGDWRPINFEIPPFNFSKPIFLIEENYEKGFEEQYKGKSLGIWKVSDIKLQE